MCAELPDPPSYLLCYLLFCLRGCLIRPPVYFPIDFSVCEAACSALLATLLSTFLSAELPGPSSCLLSYLLFSLRSCLLRPPGYFPFYFCLRGRLLRPPVYLPEAAAAALRCGGDRFAWEISRGSAVRMRKEGKSALPIGSADERRWGLFETDS